MGEVTKIQWCHHTFNPWRGCVKVAPECEHCYALDQAKRFPEKLGIWGPKGIGRRVMAAASTWRDPLKWNRAAEKAGERRRVFCASLADVFEDWSGPILNADGQEIRTDSEGWFGTVEQARNHDMSAIGVAWHRRANLNHVRYRLFDLIDQTPWLDWLLLTKRPENIRRMWPIPAADSIASDMIYNARRNNVWLGTSAGSQTTAERSIPELQKCRDLSPVLFVSAEPLLEGVDLTEFLFDKCPCYYEAGDCPETGAPEFCSKCDYTGTSDEPSSMIDWIIAGGESGPKARPCAIQWLSDIVDQCSAVGVPVFVKQLGQNAHDRAFSDFPDGPLSRIQTSHAKGGDATEWPSELQVRDFPTQISVGSS